MDSKNVHKIALDVESLFSAQNKVNIGSQFVKKPLHRFSVIESPRVIDANCIDWSRRFENIQTNKKESTQNSKNKSFSHFPAENTTNLANIESKKYRQWQDVEKHFPYAKISATDEFRTILTQLLFLGSLFYIPFVALYVYRRFCTTKRRRLIFFLVFFTFIFIPLKPSMKVRRWKGWKSIHKYHRTTLILEDPASLPSIEPTIFACVPHGIIPVGQAMLSTNGFNDVVGILRTVVADAVFKIPIYGQIIKLIGGIPASKSVLNESLKNSNSIILSPGGIAELYDAHQSKEKVRLKNRKGFIRLALENGAIIRPVYCFGNSVSFRIARIWRLFRPFSRLFRVAIAMFHGRYGLPISYRVPIMLAIGRGLKFPTLKNPTHDDIERAHQKFISEIQRIFNQYKELYGWKYRELEIV